MSSAASVNPFAMLDDDDDAPAAATGAKEVTKRAPNPPQKKDAPAPAPAASSAAGPGKGSDKGGSARGGGGKDGNRRPPKREFDRHSGTGRGARSDGHEDKKGGHGKGNWGGKGDAGAEDGEEAAPVELTEEEKAAQEAAAEERRKEAAAMTLEEYQKKQAAAAADKAKEAKEERKAEAIDMKGLKIKSDPDDVEEIRIGDTSGGKKKDKAKKSKELFTDVNFTTPPIETSSPSGGRGAFSRPGCLSRFRGAHKLLRRTLCRHVAVLSSPNSVGATTLMPRTG